MTYYYELMIEPETPKRKDQPLTDEELKFKLFTIGLLGGPELPASKSKAEK